MISIELSHLRSSARAAAPSTAHPVHHVVEVALRAVGLLAVLYPYTPSPKDILP